jgi:hypothetical protein
VFLVLFGAVMLGVKMNSDSGQALAGRDVLMLIGIGMCFGAGLIITLDRWRK